MRPASFYGWAVLGAAFAIIALSIGTLFTLGVITREYFGEAVMGTAYGWVFFISCMGMGLGSFAGGAIHDALGSYQGLFVGSFAVGAMAAVLGGTLQAPRPATAPRTA